MSDLFFGGFRIHEILSQKQMTFDPAFTLLNKDIKIVTIKIGNRETNLLQVLVKSPKEDRIGRNIIVDVYETNGQFCPIKYYKK